jgi:hypothetical protein
MFGMDLINATAAANTEGLGIHYFNTNTIQKRVAVFGAGLYWDNSGTWTDVTGAITLTPGNLCQMIDHQLGANEYIIGCNGVDAVFKWTGAGNAAVLGGSPPVFSSVEKYHDTIFGSNGQYNYFSDIGDPETWNTTDWVLAFHKDIVCQHKIGDTLAVFMADSVGSVNGYSFLDYQVEQERIGTFGCVGRLAACKAKYGQNQQDVLAVMAKDGLHFVDAAFNHQHIFGKDWIQDFSAANLSKCSLAYDNTEKFLYCAMPYSTEANNGFLVAVDMISGAIWPCPDIHTNFLKAMSSCLDANGNEFVYFVDDAGYAFKFNRLTNNYHTGTATQGIDAYWGSKKIDLKDVHEVRWVSSLAAEEGDWNYTLGIKNGVQLDSSVSASVNLLGTGDLLDSTFILDASTLTDNNYVFEAVNGVGCFGRFFSMFIENDNVDEPFNIKSIELQVRRRRMGYADS